MTSYPLTVSGHLSGEIENILLEDISYPTDSLRNCQDDEEIDELKDSIMKNGLLQPIMVRPMNDHFEIVAGCRRFYACKLLDFKKIACIVVEMDDLRTFIISLSENIKRKSLLPLEEANAFKRYICDKGWGSISQLASQIGKSPSYITKRIALLNLPEDVQNKINKSILPPSTAEELFAIDKPERQSHLANLISKRHLSIKQVREIMKDDPYHWKNSDTNNIRKDAQWCDKAIASLRIALNKMSNILEEIEEDTNNNRNNQNAMMIRELLSFNCRTLHNQIDNILRAKKKLSTRIIDDKNILQ